jgi:hypothetical protein
MGTMTFQLPDDLPREAVRELERASLAGGPDNMPYPTEVELRGSTLALTRHNVSDSCYLVAPWKIEGFGWLMGTSATLNERPSAASYHFLIELARGKVNQVRCQAADWQTGGLQIAEALHRQIAEASVTFGHAVCTSDPREAAALAERALVLAYQAASTLVDAYLAQVFTIRHQRQIHSEQLDTTLSTRLTPAAMRPELTPLLRGAFNRVVVPLSWHTVESEETIYRWENVDRLLDWAEANELDVTAGPLIDFSSTQLPAWLWLWERDVPSIATFMCRFVEAAVRRYRARIRRWQLTAASNWASVLSLSEDEMMGLTFRLGEAARQVDPSLELLIGVTQPWGEHMAVADRTYSPFIFADNLIRSGLNLSALDVEVVMGVKGRGSYCRDLLEVSRLLDLYALLGVPLQVTLGFPAGSAIDPEADPELTTGAGTWKEPCSPQVQADWANGFAALALCKPYVQAVHWVHFSDAEPHVFPSCGLIDPQGQPRPALAALQALRAQHLR